MTGAVEIYDSGSGELTLDDSNGLRTIENGILVTAIKRTVALRRLSDDTAPGSTRVIQSRSD